MHLDNSIVGQSATRRKSRLAETAIIRASALLVLLVAALRAQPPAAIEAPLDSRDTLDGENARPLALNQFQREPLLKVPQTLLTKARFPVVDVRTHFRFRLRHSIAELDQFVELMDRNNIGMCVSLDGRLGEAWYEHADYLWKRYADRFVIFVKLDWQGDGEADAPETWDCHRPDFAHRLVQRLTPSVSEKLAQRLRRTRQN